MDKIKLIIKDCREYLKNYGEAFITEEELILIEKRIKELEEALLKVKDKNTTLFITCRNSIPKQKIKDLLTEIQEEYNKVQEQFDCIWNKKSKDNYDRYKLQEFSAMQQQLGFFIGKLEEILEDK